MRMQRFLVLAVMASLAGFARADEPIDDPEVMPAQFVQPVAPVGGSTVGAVADPPPPTVRIQVRVNSHVGPQKDIPYKITVTNTSSADAYLVKVRNPIPDGVAAIPKAEPKPDKIVPRTGTAPAILNTSGTAQPVAQLPKELVWNIGTLHPNESKTIELTLTPSADAKEVRNQAYVSFEYGEAVVTRIDKAKLAVRKLAPKQAMSTEPIPVRVEVTNNGRVTVSNVKLVEDVSKGFEFNGDAEGEKGTSAGQRVWNIGALRPGERKSIEYRLTARGAGELVAQSAVSSAEVPDAERAESTTKVQVAELALDLQGEANASPGSAVQYTATVTNTGSLPLSEVRVTANIPASCTVTKMTNGGQRSRDQLTWVIPARNDGPLMPGKAYALRFWLKAGSSGQRTVRVTADAGRGVEQSREVVTAFQASAVLSWQASTDVNSLAVGNAALLTIRVKNTGGETARGTQLRVVLPPEVRIEKATPGNLIGQAGEVAFNVTSLPAGEMETYTLTFRGQKPGPARFVCKLSSDVLGQYPLTKEQEVLVSASP